MQAACQTFLGADLHGTCINCTKCPQLMSGRTYSTSSSAKPKHVHVAGSVSEISKSGDVTYFNTCAQLGRAC